MAYSILLKKRRDDYFVTDEDGNVLVFPNDQIAKKYLALMGDLHIVSGDDVRKYDLIKVDDSEAEEGYEHTMNYMLDFIGEIHPLKNKYRQSI